MDQLINKLRIEHPNIQFARGNTASWSPKKRIITIPVEETKESQWALLHEMGHALLGHSSFESDAQLLSKELDAWLKAQELGLTNKVEIPIEHIEDCLDTYRDWLHKRSCCPSCHNHGLQRSQKLYYCYNCKTSWRVSIDRFCRSYRLKVRDMQEAGQAK